MTDLDLTISNNRDHRLSERLAYRWAPDRRSREIAAARGMAAAAQRARDAAQSGFYTPTLGTSVSLDDSAWRTFARAWQDLAESRGVTAPEPAKSAVQAMLEDQEAIDGQ